MGRTVLMKGPHVGLLVAVRLRSRDEQSNKAHSLSSDSSGLGEAATLVTSVSLPLPSGLRFLRTLPNIVDCHDVLGGVYKGPMLWQEKRRRWDQINGVARLVHGVEKCTDFALRNFC